MKLKDVVKLEESAKEVWVVSPALHFDVDNQDFTEMVSVNLGQKTKYRYIVPATDLVLKNLETYTQKYAISASEFEKMFLVLEPSAFLPFMNECAIYDASTECIACAAPPMENTDDVIKYNKEASKSLAEAFKAVWFKYKRSNP